LRAENLNLGQSSGISLNADVPWLSAQAELFFIQQNEQTKLDLIFATRRLIVYSPLPPQNKPAKKSCVRRQS
jgi:hypothetical protein